MHIDADDLPAFGLETAEKAAEIRGADASRARSRERVKQQIVEQRQFKDIRLVDEEVAEMPYRPVACRHDVSADDRPQESRA